MRLGPQSNDRAQRGPDMGISKACKGTCTLTIENIRIAWSFVRERRAGMTVSLGKATTLRKSNALVTSFST